MNNMYKYYVGVDPGKTGGISLISSRGKILHTSFFDQDTKEFDPNILYRKFEAINKIINKEDVLAIIEKVSAMPGQGVSSMFKLGTMYGLVRIATVSMGWKYELVHPRVWSKLVHKGTDTGTTTKEKSKIIASRLFPEYDFRKSLRAKVPHSGMVDATLLAWYGYLIYNGG